MKAIHFFSNRYDMDEWAEEKDYNVNVLRDYDAVEMFRKEMSLFEGDILVATLQMCFLSTEWFDLGFRVFVHDRTGVFEIVLGEGNERTSRHIRRAHNLFRMWENGEFGLSEEDE